VPPTCCCALGALRSRSDHSHRCHLSRRFDRQAGRGELRRRTNSGEINNPTGDEPTDAGPTPPDIGLPPEDGPETAGPTPGDVGLPPDADDVGDHIDQELSTDSADASAVSNSETQGGSDSQTSVRDVTLARTGFPVLLLASLAGVSLAAGLGLLGLRRD